jgi:predicted nucleic acid-binding protein
MFLLDTNVISELRRARNGRADVAVTTWASSVSQNSMFLSTITVLELETGVLQAERRDPAQGVVLRRWLHGQVLPGFAGRILGFDLPVALHCAILHVPNPRSYRDALIAATGIVHGMTVVTRNVADFAGTGVAVLNPWAD